MRLNFHELDPGPAALRQPRVEPFTYANTILLGAGRYDALHAASLRQNPVGMGYARSAGPL